ncbi:hypothetical protein FTW19_18725 [Terriglobus albidus]|uniref:PLAT domain-containing protein n=1 Tax=Terriglobus albidus TaxID=1592106 RepID=A0A5B9EIA7_9BACT|nr:hypothetical protein [Terriglobus albidus]QEE29836.1 hypothetical protein FTW19_18725 [Terriglobus albidus]
MPALKESKPPVLHLTTSGVEALPPNAYVVGVVARFDTTSDDKDGDTRVRVTLKDPSGTVFANVDNVTGHWDNDSTSYVNLFITAQRLRSQLNGNCTLEVHIDTNGNDTWDFNVTLIVTYSDGIQAMSSFNGHWLSQDNQTNDYGVTNLG